MTRPDLPSSPQDWLAQAFARQAVAWAMRTDAPDDAIPVLRRVALEVSLATSDGHVCADLAEISVRSGTDLEDMRRLLLASGVVGTSEAPGAMPLILDSADRLYLHRYFDYERRLAHRLLAASAGMCAVGADAGALMRLSFDRNRATHPDWQKIAVALALLRKLTVISGGPGTGKTSVIVQLLGCLLAQDPDSRIRLAAPTGKAAARMLQTIRERSAALPADIRDRLPDEAFTIHRLLGISNEEGISRYHAGNPLPLDALIIDEASMLDIALATRLLEAVPPHARIVLLGDKDQLSAVESGAVFAEISAAPSLSPNTIAAIAGLAAIPAETIVASRLSESTPLHGNVVWLSENYRFASDSAIGSLADDINGGRSDAALVLLQQPEADVRWIEDGGNLPSRKATEYMIAGYADYLQSLRSGNVGPRALFGVFDRFRVLCALREGPRGVIGVNQEINRLFRQNLNHPLDRNPRSPWYPGRPVMVLRNDYILHLFNGDIGIALPDDAGHLMVHFPDGGDGFRAIAPTRLPEHETAFAMTVHKSQGSEFDEILLIMPAGRSRAVGRELLYTAVTRARKRVMLASDRAVLEMAIACRLSKRSGLRDRMREISDGKWCREGTRTEHVTY